MAQLIVKSPYLPPNSISKIEGYLRYISTREGVEKIKKKDSVAYSVEHNEAFLNADGISNIKGELTKHIFRQDLMCLYDKQNESRDNLRQVGEQQIYDIIKQVNSRLYDNPKIEALLVSLSEYLSDYEGKKVYGYFSTKGKRIVNSIIDEMEKDPIMSKLRALHSPKLAMSRNTHPRNIRSKRQKIDSSIQQIFHLRYLLNADKAQ